MKKFIIFISFLIFYFLLPGKIFALDYYVSTTGNNSNPGTIDLPFLTISYAVTQLSPGDILYIRGGTYAESLIDEIPSGLSWNSPVTLKAYSGETPILKPNSGDRVLHFSGDYGADPPEYIIIDGLTLDGENINHDTVKITTGATYIRIQNSIIKNSPAQGVLINGQPSGTGHVDLINNEIYNIGTNVGYDHGIYSQAPYNLIVGNTIYDTVGYGIHLWDGDSSNSIIYNNIIYDINDWAIGLFSSDNTLVYNNVIYKDTKGSGIRVEYGPSNVEVYNNTIYGVITGISIGQSTNTIVKNNLVVSGGTGIAIGSNASYPIVTNNLSTNNSTDYTSSSTTLTSSDNYYGAVYSVYFLDADNFSLNILSGSKAIDTGVDLSDVLVDIDGVVRPQGNNYDIGAYEYEDPLVSSPWFQTDWSGGNNQFDWFEINKFYSQSISLNTQTNGQISIPLTSDWCSNSYCDTSYIYRNKIYFDNTDDNLGISSETLTNFPALVKLDSTKIDYSKINDDGSDIRFTDSDGNDIPYEIETWNESGTSIIWVSVPEIEADSDSTYVYMYYGNALAVDHQQSAGVWENYVGVWHLDESGSGIVDEFSDSTGNDNDGRGGNGVSGRIPTVDNASVIGNGQSFDGSNDLILISNDASMDFPDNEFTISLWIKSLSSSGAKSYISNWSNNYPVPPFYMFRQGHLWYVSDGTYSINEASFYDPGAWDYSWQHFTFVFTNNTLHFYRNSTLRKTFVNNNINGFDFSTPVLFSCTPSYVTSEYCFLGSMDEIKISANVRSVAEITAEYKNQVDDFVIFDSTSVYLEPPISSNLISSVFDTGKLSTWGKSSISATTPNGTSISLKVRTALNSDMQDATSFDLCNSIANGDLLIKSNCVSDGERYLQYQIILNSDSVSQTPIITELSFDFREFHGLTQNNSDSISSSMCTLSNLIGRPLVWLSDVGNNYANFQVRNTLNEDISSYYVLYGFEPDSNQFGAQNLGNKNSLSIKINDLKPSTTYYFRFRFGNGCATGPWTENIKVKTSSINEIFSEDVTEKLDDNDSNRVILQNEKVVKDEQIDNNQKDSSNIFKKILGLFKFIR